MNVTSRQYPRVRVLHIGDGPNAFAWTLDIPADPDAQPLAWRARYAPESITPADLMDIAALLDQCAHLIHGAPTTRIATGTVAAVRRAARGSR